MWFVFYGNQYNRFTGYRPSAHECIMSCIKRMAAKMLFYSQKLIVFLDPLPSTWSARLEMASTHGNSQICDEAVYSLPATMRNHSSPICPVSHYDGGFGLSQGSDLIGFNQYSIGDVFFDASLNPFDVGDKQVISNQLDPVTQRSIQLLPARPIVFREAIFQYRNRVLVDPGGIETNQLLSIDLTTFRAQMVKTVLIETAGCWVDSDLDLRSRGITGPFNCLNDQLNGI
ncbi:hypothetical protein ALP92_200077 [Pseudomonas syringae pv. primulae]|uniref:Uncharacterized protein n=1 Tax=Pseudomonas syringae pv. primulae TaxID=251707 RepID=A0A3M4RS87_9PSED|nr:hypothetical protein ALP92_200077 [Pseudomonas syringae pv. primulae]